ncbi:hypothetical protein B4U80_14225 [Leptotrombidium deliense]|uniref:Transglutaminase C-terminal domain-containing protein n=1 Tax=Leptotrombidium deliense TaxID=299467 RepID=A0A443RZV4_9ACAR|nr:hypothetical protein B4U80_14225 [Leptotrombidium deliense]
MNHIHVGQPIRVEILLRNHNVEPVKLTLSVTASSVYYNGKLKSEIKNKALKFTLKGLQRLHYKAYRSTYYYRRSICDERK